MCQAWDQKRQSSTAIWTHPITLSDRSGAWGPGAHFPGGGGGKGSNRLPRTIRIAIRKIFSQNRKRGKRRGLENFLEIFALQGKYFGPKLFRGPVGATARAYAIPKYFRDHSPVLKGFGQEKFAQKAKSSQIFANVGDNKRIVSFIVWVIVPL